jgi:hypothetical protein
MKNLFLPLACLTVFALAGGVMAAPPGKATIRHCGCVLDSADQVGMAYVQISVSSKAKGHLQHVVESLDSCVMADGVTLVDFSRTGPDCQVDGTPLVGLGSCTDLSIDEGQQCGNEVVQQ